MKESIYLDHAATTYLDEDVLALQHELSQKLYGNPSSLHAPGKESRRVLEHARQVLADEIGATAGEVTFTSGGTESDNTALLTTAWALKERGRHVITTQVEHEAVLRPMARLERLGFDVTYLPVDETGQLDLTELAEAIRPDTILVSVMTVNNETGVIFPIEEIGQLLAEKNIVFHTDAVQALGPLQIDVKKWQVDLLSASAHKIYGPRGVGLLYQNSELDLPSLLLGGEQERGRRAGTEDVVGAAAFAEAATISHRLRQSENERYQQLLTHLLTELSAKDIRAELNGASAAHYPGIVNIYLKDYPSEQLLIQLDLAGIAVSAGSACTAGSLQSSHVLQAMYGPDSSRLAHSIRVSFGRQTTIDELDDLVDALVKIKKSK